MKIIKTEIPDQMFEQLHRLVQAGWFTSQDQIVRQALEKFLHANRPEVLEKHVREDVEWALHGSK
jgi:Arc/MetJ-type ribon-helix-helix transcriptional regulator